MNGQPAGTEVFDATGRRLKDSAAQPAVDALSALRAAFGVPDARTAAAGFGSGGTAVACFELHSGATVIEIQVVVDLIRGLLPYVVLDGSLRGDIFTPPGTAWRVTAGSFDGLSLFFVGELGPLEIDPGTTDAPNLTNGASSIDIVGIGKAPLTYPGLLGFSAFPSIPHTALFKGWQACA
jgi:hypothetical protein